MRIQGLTIGREFYKRFIKREMPDNYIEEQVGKLDEDEFTVLLAHNPDYGDEYFKYGADLFLSGHLHGGIVRLPIFGGVISPRLKFFPKYDGGIYEKGRAQMILSRGLGYHTLPIRLFNPGELICVKLSPLKDK